MLKKLQQYAFRLIVFYFTGFSVFNYLAEQVLFSLTACSKKQAINQLAILGFVMKNNAAL